MSCNPEGRGGAEVGEEGGSRREASCKVEQDRCKGSREEGRNSSRVEQNEVDRERRIPGTGKPGGLLSMGSHRVGHN